MMGDTGKPQGILDKSKGVFPLLNWRRCNEQIMAVKKATVMLAWRELYHIFLDRNESPNKSSFLL